jgi:hypothetical protein
MKKRILLIVPVVLGMTLVACNSTPPAVAHEPVHVDSIIPREVAMQQFQAGLIQPARLAGGANSRDALVRSFIHALEKRDTAAFRGLVLDRSEFAFLYYPTNAQGLPPYDLNPGLMWFMLDEASRKGIQRALAARSGQPLGYLGYRCEGKPSVEGQNTVWGPCLVQRLRARGDTIFERLFGPIIERNGVFKFVSLANRL